MKSDVRLAFDAQNHLGETPVWSERDQALWWVNCEKPPELHRWSPTTGAHDTWPMPQRIGGFAEKASGGLVGVGGTKKLAAAARRSGDICAAEIAL